MKNLKTLVAFLLAATFGATSFAQHQLDGAWQHEVNGEVHTMLISGKYYMVGVAKKDNGAFVSACGGKAVIDAKSIQFDVEFNSADKNDVGSVHLFDYSLTSQGLQTKHHDDITLWKKIDESKTALSGTWLFSGRKVADTLQPYTPGVRKTMKMLTGSRFQWAAFNTQTKEFFGTGGGTYTAKDGKYAETIGFFSRDNSRVGATLQFDYKVNLPHWMHSGLSSKGEPIAERWSLRSSFSDQ